MPVFETAGELYTCIGGLFERMKSQAQVQQELSIAEINGKVCLHRTGSFYYACCT